MESTIIQSSLCHVSTLMDMRTWNVRIKDQKKKKERENQTWSSDEDGYQITIHPLPFFPLPTSSWQTRPRGCLAAGPTMGKTLQLYWNPGRTNVRPNSSINLQVNQGPPLPLPTHLSFLIPGWPSFYTPFSSPLEIEMFSRSCMRGDVYVPE